MAWEYKTVDADWPDVEATFNQLSADGWELVTASTQVVTAPVGTAFGGRELYDQSVHTWAIFRKEKTA
jgi:hypothetical protein